jgi:hypothetical protein
VQSSTTKQVSVANLTAGRAISATQLTLTTGNLIVASGQGIDFSATPGTGTSELLADYEEGTWTPATYGGNSTYTAQSGKYIKVGNAVTINGRLKINVLGTGSAYLLTGLPFLPVNDGIGCSVNIGIWNLLATTPVYLSGYIYPNFNGIELHGTVVGTFSLPVLSVLTDSSEVYFSGTYYV